jgi:hypothetical protein
VPPRLGVEVGIAFAIGLAVGLAVVFAVIGGQEPPVPVLTTPPGLSEPRVDPEVVVGYDHNAAGAIAAATNYVVALGGRLILAPAGRSATVSAVSAADVDPAVAVRFTDPPAVEEQTGLLADLRAGVPVVATVAPVGARVAALTETRTTAQERAVAVVGATRLGCMDMAWSTETLRLGRERTDGAGDWRLLRWDDGGAPVPAPPQAISAAPQTLAATEGMGGFRHASAG